MSNELKHKVWKLPKIPSKIAAVPKDQRSAIDKLIGNPKQLYTNLQGYREDAWRTTVLAFEANPNSTYNAFYYIAQHPMFWHFHQWRRDTPVVHETHLVHEDGWARVSIHPVMVNPKDRRISEDVHLNTKLEWWFEYGPSLWNDNAGEGINGHDHKCDGGASTYDKAIIKIARSIHKHYGNDRRRVVKKWSDTKLPKENSVE